ncbi:MAG: shikimate kinase [Cyanobacteriota bacterium]|nr:shikimate kinase [Cyanobacteriota bacterium]
MPTDAASVELVRRLRGLNLYLVGMMGAGKSAVGRPLARALGYRFIDADAALERSTGRPIAQIFAADGEEGFRDLETAVLDQLAQWHSLVVATGGGVVTRPVNWGHLRQGVVIWLDAPEEVLLQRLRADATPRPLLADPDPAGRLRDLLEQRRPLYAQADLHVSQATESPEGVASRVVEALPALLREDNPQPPLEGIRLRHADGGRVSSLNASAGETGAEHGGESTHASTSRAESGQGGSEL